MRNAFVLAVFAILTACANGGGLPGPSAPGGGGGGPSPVPADTIGISIPTGSIGVEDDPVWGTVGGYTQSTTSQVLAFAPGTKITLQNLSSTDPHTFDVISATSGPPATFPANPNLSFTPKGGNTLKAGYATGTINPKGSVTVTLSVPGIYLIGCAYHYAIGMRDVIQVSASATPGPQASAQPSAAPLGEATNAQLVDQRGHTFTLNALRGSRTVVTFVSARCGDACPLIDGQFAAAALELQRRNVRAHLLTLTLDPQHDTPRVMRDLARRFDADARTWQLASGTPDSVSALMRTFGVVAIAGRDGVREAHTTYVYELDERGRLVKTMLAGSGLAGDIVADLTTQSKGL